MLSLGYEAQTQEQQQQQQPSSSGNDDDHDAVSFIHLLPLQRSNKLIQVNSSSPLTILQRSVSLETPIQASPSPSKKSKVLEVVASLSPMKLVRRSKTRGMMNVLQEKEVVLEDEGGEMCRDCEVEHVYGSCASTTRVCAWRKGIEEGEFGESRRSFVVYLSFDLTLLSQC